MCLRFVGRVPCIGELIAHHGSSFSISSCVLPRAMSRCNVLMPHLDDVPPALNTKQMHFSARVKIQFLPVFDLRNVQHSFTLNIVISGLKADILGSFH